MSYSPIIKQILLDLAAKKTYLKKGQLPPKGKVVRRGPKNGIYYEDSDISSSVADILNKHEGSPHFIMEDVYKMKTLIERTVPMVSKLEGDLKASQEKGDTKSTKEIQKQLEILKGNISRMHQAHDDGLTAYGIAKKNREKK